MEVYIRKNDQNYGPYDMVQVSEYVSSGSFLATDLACPVGSSEWHTIEQVLQMHAATTSQSSPPVPEPVSEEEVQTQSPLQKTPTDPVENINSDAAPSQAGGRHGCLTAYLVFGIVVNSLGVIGNLMASFGNSWANPGLPLWVFWVSMVFGVFNIACMVALLKWKKWGFWGFVASACLVLPINLMAGTGLHSVIGVIGIAFLYGVLQIGKHNKGWPQLK